MMTNSDTQERPILVLGGTGKTGSRVAARLTDRGIPVRIGSRAGSPAFDWNDAATWAPTLEGVGAAYLVYYPDLAVPGASETVGRLAREAVRRGVEHLVLLSGRGEDGARRGEQAVQAAGAPWTIVRASWFSQNFSEGLPPRAGAQRRARIAGRRRRGAVRRRRRHRRRGGCRADRPVHVGQLYEVTAPRLLTFADVAAEISAAAGRTVQYVPVTSEE